MAQCFSVPVSLTQFYVASYDLHTYIVREEPMHDTRGRVVSLWPAQDPEPVSVGGQRSVTRLGEFPPFGRLFSFCSVLQITEIAQIIGLLISAVYGLFSFWTKTAWATFWAILSKTHLVTLDRSTQLLVLPQTIIYIRSSHFDRPKIYSRSKWAAKELLLHND
jgi:hypothetical protein